MMGKAAEKDIIRQVLAGLAIGFGCILPGVSGGVMAVTFGLYRPILDALVGLPRAFWPNLRFLLPIAAGGAAGLLLGATLLDWLAADYMPLLLIFFIGLVLGGLPAFIREANADGFSPRYLAATLAGAALACSLMLLDNDPAAAVAPVLSGWQYVLAGAIIAVGALVPGISTSFILIFLGWYAPMLAAISGLQWRACLLAAAGALLAGIVVLIAIRWLFAHCRPWTYYLVLGFLLGSVALVCPQLTGTAWPAFLLLLPGCALSRLFTRK